MFTMFESNGELLYIENLRFRFHTRRIISTTTGCGRYNSHISKNHCGVLKAGSGVWSVPLGRVHNKVFSRRHAAVG
jgi:hypothetical protein